MAGAESVTMMPGTPNKSRDMSEEMGRSVDSSIPRANTGMPDSGRMDPRQPPDSGRMNPDTGTPDSGGMKTDGGAPVTEPLPFEFRNTHPCQQYMRDSVVLWLSSGYDVVVDDQSRVLRAGLILIAFMLITLSPLAPLKCGPSSSGRGLDGRA